MPVTTVNPPDGILQSINDAGSVTHGGPAGCNSQFRSFMVQFILKLQASACAVETEVVGIILKRAPILLNQRTVFF
jgi:hypothetical protein